ncbi:MAG TPA: alanine racemase, partial [Opitutales bacterium]|nr:alanine racemase [Opitutales bacterium]
MATITNARCWVEIDLGRLERNLRKIRSSMPPHIRYVAVVKADAYGHGLAQTASRLMRAGADAFAVANVQEAGAIREIGTGWPILILSAVLPQEDHLLADYQAMPAVSTIEEVQRFAKLGRDSGRPFAVHLKIDTGMGRLGVWHEGAPALYDAIVSNPALRLDGIFTHFSSADSNAEYTRLQRDRFLGALSKMEGLDPATMLIHADNSAGLESLPVGGPFNGVRVGLLQFGVRPYPGSLLADVHPEPVLGFHSRVGLVKELPEGAYVSYNRTCCLRRLTKTAIICAGYGDGISTGMSSRGQVIVNGRRAPILGRVTMDQIIVDVTDLPPV